MDSLYTSNKNFHDNVQIIFGFYNMYKKSLRTYVWWPLCTSIWTADYIFQKLDQMAALWQRRIYTKWYSWGKLAMSCQCSKMASVINTITVSSSSSKPHSDRQSTPLLTPPSLWSKELFSHTLKSQICHQQFLVPAVVLKKQRNAPGIDSGSMLEQTDLDVGEGENTETFHVLYQGVTSLMSLAMPQPQFPHLSNKGRE